MDIINSPSQFKGLAHGENERTSLGLRGLLPSAVRTVEIQEKLVLHQLEKCESDLNRYILLRDLQDTNERLFYKVVCKNIEKIMPLIYTPVVGEACIEFSKIFRKPKGIFITINDSSHVYDVLSNWPEKNIKAIVVTDGGRILGLGDLAANGMGIPIGKLSLYTAAAGIPPSTLLPVTLDVGTDNKELLNDLFYIGLKQSRSQGEKYYEFVDEFMRAVVQKYGETCLIQFEDFGNENAFFFMEKYKNKFCTFNDDIQGTGSVTVAGILSAVENTCTSISNHTFLFCGAGQAVLGIADLLIMLLQEEGISEKDACSKIWLIDSKGLITSSRDPSEINERTRKYAKNYNAISNLEDIVNQIKPTFLIGASAQHKIFTGQVLKAMLKTCKEPVIFALSNPTNKSECTAEEAYTFTDGRCVFASGTAFQPFTYKGRKFHSSQANNAYIFPGVALALIFCEVKLVNEKLFLIAAKALAATVTREHRAEGRIFPPLKDIRKVSLNVATKVADFLFQENIATLKPKPDDLEAFLCSKQYNYEYDGLDKI